MAIIDTTNTVDSTIHLKAKFPHNKVGSNFYIENLQYKRNQTWEFRPNLVDIEEELDKQCEYTQQPPVYTPIDVAIRKVKNEKGQDIGADWADIAFKDLNHYNELGVRYRFSLDFPDMSIMTEEEKYYNTSVWLCVNRNPVDASNNCIIRRCNSSLVFGGSPEGNVDNITEIHYEPVILENDLKYINIYYTMTVPLPQAEWYATMQLNYFTKCLSINDRLIFNMVDLKNRDNNVVFKVKAIAPHGSLKTFTRYGSEDIENIPLITVALDKDTISSEDNFETRLANQPPVYFTEEIKPTYQYYLEMNSVSNPNKKTIQKINNMEDGAVYEGTELFGEYTERILQGETRYYCCSLMFNNKIKKIQMEISADLEVCPKNDKPENYFKLDILGNNIFSITNIKRYISKPLVVTCSCVNPDDSNKIISQSYEFTLGGFY